MFTLVYQLGPNENDPLKTVPLADVVPLFPRII